MSNESCEISTLLLWTPNIYLHAEIKHAVDAYLEDTCIPNYGSLFTAFITLQFSQIRPCAPVCGRGNPEGTHNIAECSVNHQLCNYAKTHLGTNRIKILKTLTVCHVT